MKLKANTHFCDLNNIRFSLYAHYQHMQSTVGPLCYMQYIDYHTFKATQTLRLLSHMLWEQLHVYRCINMVILPISLVPDGSVGYRLGTRLGVQWTLCVADSIIQILQWQQEMWPKQPISLFNFLINMLVYLLLNDMPMYVSIHCWICGILHWSIC